MTYEGTSVLEDTTSRRERLGQQIKESDALRRWSLPLAVLASVVATLLNAAFTNSRLGALLGAAAGPVITSLFTTRGRVQVRLIGISLVTLLAVGLTITGFTVPELLNGGKSLIGHRQGTFVPTGGSDTSGGSDNVGGNSGGGSSAEPSAGPRIATVTELTCEEAAVGQTGHCPDVTVRSAGTEALRVTGVETEGTAAAEFQATSRCSDALPPNVTCPISVEFHPAGAGPRQAVLVVHQNLPGPATRIPLQGVGRETDSPPPGQPGSPEPAAASPIE